MAKKGIRPGRKPEISLIAMEKLLKKHKIFSKRGKLLPLLDPVWKNISNAVQNKLKPASIRLYVFNNRNGIQKKLKTFHKSRRLIAVNRFSRWKKGTLKMQYGDKILQEIQFDLSLDEQTWLKIKPEEKIYPSEKCTRRVLQHDWTNIVFNKLYEERKLPCALICIRGEVKKSQPFLYMQCYCSDPKCGVLLEGSCQEEPCNNDGIVIRIKTFDATMIRHTKKRPLTGNCRIETGEELLHTKPAFLREKKALDSMKFGDNEPANLNSTLVYRKLRTQSLNRYYNYKAGESIEHLLFTDLMGSVIRLLVSIPFQMHYWTQEQIIIWNYIAENDGFISIDASGGVVRKMNKAGVVSNYNFLYQIVAKLGGKIIPIAQMISSRHDTLSITRWLKAWNRSGAACPKEIVTDMSLALQNSVTLSFNHTSYSEYLNQCYLFLRSLNGKTNTATLPEIFLRIDIAHLIKAVSRWKGYNENKIGLSKDFYLRCIGFMSTTTELEFIKNCIYSILVVCGSEYDEQCKEELKFLMEKLASYDQKIVDDFLKSPENPGKDLVQNENEKMYGTVEEIEKRYDEELKEQTVNKDKKPKKKLTELNETIDALYKKAIKNCSRKLEDLNLKKTKKNLNSFWCPKIISNLKNLFRQFPAWTNVMLKNFDHAGIVATSARSETYFGYVKNIIKIDAPLHPNKFLTEHLRSIDGSMCLAQAYINGLKNPESSSEAHVISLNSTDLNHSQSVLLNSTHMEVENQDCSMDPENSLIPDDKLLETSDSDLWKFRKSSESLFKSSTPDKNIKELNKKDATKNARGKHCVPQADIELIYENNLVSTSKKMIRQPILQNGNIQGPVDINSEKYSVRSTDKFDTIFEIWTKAYSQVMRFRELCNCSTVHDEATDTVNCILNLTKDFCENQLKDSEIHNQRAMILYNLKQFKNSVIEINVDVQVLFELLMTSHSNAVKVIKCKCGGEENKSLSTMVKFEVDNHNNLEDALNALVRTSEICPSCNTLDINVEYCLHHYIPITIKQIVNLSEIPCKLIIGGERFELIGIVCLQKKSFSNSKPHQICYCRTINGNRWERRDDSSTYKKPTPVKNSSIFIQTELIIYVQV